MTSFFRILFRKIYVFFLSIILGYLLFYFLFEWVFGAILCSLYLWYIVHGNIKYHTTFFDRFYNDEKEYSKALSWYIENCSELVRGELIVSYLHRYIK